MLALELLGGSADVDATPPDPLAGRLKLKFFFCCLSMVRVQVSSTKVEVEMR